MSPAVAHPDLREGEVLRSRLLQAPRAPITDRTGAPIVVDRPVVTVGLLGAYAVMVAVFLAIAAFSLKWAAGADAATGHDPVAPTTPTSGGDR